MDYPAARFVTQRAIALRSQGMQLGWSRLFKGTTIRGRLTGALAVLLLLWCAASAAMLFEVARIHQRAERIGLEHLPRLMRANALIDQANLTARLMGEMQLVDGPVRARQRIDRIMVIRRQVEDEMRWFEAHSGRDEVQRLLAGIATQRLHYWAGQDRLFALVQQDPLAARAYYLADVLGMQQGYVQMLGQLIDLENAHADATAARTRVEYERTLYLLMGVSGMVLLLVGVVGIAVLRSITEPLEEAAVWARVVAQGNLDAEPAVRGRDGGRTARRRAAADGQVAAPGPGAPPGHRAGAAGKPGPAAPVGHACRIPAGTRTADAGAGTARRAGPVDHRAADGTGIDADAVWRS